MPPLAGRLRPDGDFYVAKGAVCETSPTRPVLVERKTPARAIAFWVFSLCDLLLFWNGKKAIDPFATGDFEGVVALQLVQNDGDGLQKIHV